MSSVSVATLQDTQIRHLPRNETQIEALNGTPNPKPLHAEKQGVGESPDRTGAKPETRPAQLTPIQNPQNINENGEANAGANSPRVSPPLAKPGQPENPGQKVWEVEYERGFMKVESTPDQVKQAHDFYEDWVENESKGQKERARRVKGTVFSIMQQREDENGHIQMTQEQWDGFIEALEKDDLLYRSACIWHDKDESETGGPGRLHFHGVVQLKPGVEARRIQQISKLLKIPSSRIEVPEFAWSKGRKITTGRNFAELSFFDLASYLTHETKKAKDDNKYPYPREEVLTNAGFDFNEYLNAGRPKTGQGSSGKKSEEEKLGNELVNKVFYEGMTIKEARNHFDYATVYAPNRRKILNARADYLAEQPPPPFRVNIYIGGEGNAGKDITAEALARELIPGEWIPKKVEPFFTVGGDKVPWEGYDGQECVIIEEARADILIHKFGRDDLFTFLNPFPKTQSVHVKNSSTVLKNWLTIMTGPTDGQTFARQLAGEYVDKYGMKHEAESLKQGYRRIPIIVSVTPESYDVFVDLGRLHGNSHELGTYESVKNIKQDLQRVLKATNGIEDEGERAKAVRALEGKQVALIVEQVKRIIEVSKGEPISAEEVIAQFANSGIGEVMPELELKSEPEVETPKFPNNVWDYPEPPIPFPTEEEIEEVNEKLRLAEIDRLLDRLEELQSEGSQNAEMV